MQAEITVLAAHYSRGAEHVHHLASPIIRSTTLCSLLAGLGWISVACSTKMSPLPGPLPGFKNNPKRQLPQKTNLSTPLFAPIVHRDQSGFLQSGVPVKKQKVCAAAMTRGCHAALGIQGDAAGGVRQVSGAPNVVQFIGDG